MSDVATLERGALPARPIKVLVPLIREDLKRGDEAAQSAGLPYYRAAGEKMIEAKTQMQRGEFTPWIKRNFGIGERQAQQYMRLVRATADMEKRSALRFSSLNQFVRDQGSAQHGKPASWQAPVREALGKVDIDALNRKRDAADARLKEEQLRRKLAEQLIDIGYKALASKLHPDKGGSREAMARLNAVRAQLKASL